MKPRTYAVTILALMLAITTTNSYAAISNDSKLPVKERTINMTDGEKKVRLEEIKNRVNEIKAMDKSALTKEERKGLKKELRELRKEARVISGGVYLSVGAIIIIILLLILIL